MYLQTSRLQYNLQGVVSFQTAFSKKINSAFTVSLFYYKWGNIATLCISGKGFQRNVGCDIYYCVL